MFQTLTGSFIILVAMFGIIFIFAVCLAAWLTWIFLTDEEAAETTTVYEPSMVHPFRQAA